MPLKDKLSSKAASPKMNETRLTVPPKKPQKCRIILIGETGSGKSGFAHRWAHGAPPTYVDPDLNGSFRRQLKIGNDHWIVEIDELAHEETFSPSSPNPSETFKREVWGVDAVILVYKVSLRGLRSGEKPKSEEHAAATRQSRLETVRSYYGYLKRVKYQEGKLMEHLPVWIVGLQNDLRDSGVVSSKEGIELARSLGCEFMECSAKDGQKNIEKCVLNVMRDVKRQKIK